MGGAYKPLFQPETVAQGCIGQGMIDDQLLEQAMFRCITADAIDNPAVMYVTISCGGNNILFYGIIQTRAQQQGTQMLPLIAASELGFVMNTELLV